MKSPGQETHFCRTVSWNHLNLDGLATLSTCLSFGMLFAKPPERKTWRAPSRASSYRQFHGSFTFGAKLQFTGKQHWNLQTHESSPLDLRLATHLKCSPLMILNMRAFERNIGSSDISRNVWEFVQSSRAAKKKKNLQFFILLLKLVRCCRDDVPLVSSGSTMGGMRSGSSSSPACSPVARIRLRSRKSGTSMAKSADQQQIKILRSEWETWHHQLLNSHHFLASSKQNDWLFWI